MRGRGNLVPGLLAATAAVLGILVAIPVNVVSSYLPASVTGHRLAWVAGLAAAVVVIAVLTWLAGRSAGLEPQRAAVCGTAGDGLGGSRRTGRTGVGANRFRHHGSGADDRADGRRRVREDHPCRESVPGPAGAAAIPGQNRCGSRLAGTPTARPLRPGSARPSRPRTASGQHSLAWSRRAVPWLRRLRPGAGHYWSLMTYGRPRNFSRSPRSGSRARLLVTTRRPTVLDNMEARRVTVDALPAEAARRLLTRGLPAMLGPAGAGADGPDGPMAAVAEPGQSPPSR